MRYDSFDTPIGMLTLVAGDRGLQRIIFGHAAQADWRHDPDALAEAREQLQDYFDGHRRHFDLRLAPHGTLFQLSVWRSLGEIPFGQTRSYGEIAGAIGRPRAVRAVGAANGRNPLPIVLPCHRVIGSDGSLTGYAGGLEIKRCLLAHEGVSPTL